MKKPEIQITCQHCGHPFTVEAIPGATETECPECAASTPVVKANPAEDLPEKKTATLKAPRKRDLKPTPFRKPAIAAVPAAVNGPATETPPDDEPVPEPTSPPETQDVPPTEKEPAYTRPPTPMMTGLKTKPKCPECGTSMEKDAVVCLSCGHDTRSETPVTKPTMVAEPKRSSPVVPIVVTLIVVCGAAFYFFVMRKHTSAPETPRGDPGAEISSSEPEPPPFTFGEPEPEPELDPVVEMAPEEPAPEPAAAEVEMGTREQVIARLDAQRPLFSAGDNAVLTTQDGTVYRGKVIEINESAIRLYYRGSEGEVPIRALSRHSRSQVDPMFRAQFIDSLVERYQGSGTE